MAAPRSPPRARERERSRAPAAGIVRAGGVAGSLGRALLGGSQCRLAGRVSPGAREPERAPEQGWSGAGLYLHGGRAAVGDGVAFQ
ncbi:hypothetical protein P7K49_004527 [Saguinus oedipus]|uniref:Uncharacterized protein n=1 Tax=Saguinus oedipus TaxID=9490 RepID=A0ABQ9W7N9_SAGOE|nr:hypothetical protein P7K49_004527 [Saguinus oedipus]